MSHFSDFIGYSALIVSHEFYLTRCATSRLPSPLSGQWGTAQADVEAHLDWLRERIVQLDRHIEGQIAQCQSWQAQST